MATITEMVQNLSLKHSKKIKKICEPLHLCFGINHYFFSKTTSCGNYFCIGSHSNFHEDYYLNDNFKSNPFCRNPTSIKSGLYYYPYFKDNKFHVLLDVMKTNDVNPILVQTFKKNQDLFRFGYCMSPEVNHNTGLILLNNNLTLLNKFNTYFIESTKDLLKNSLDSSIHLPTEMGAQYDLSQPINSCFQEDINTRLTFLKQIGVLPDSEKLTARELEYLYFIAKGLTSHQIAMRMNISKRTVEHNIETLKCKLQCSCKTDLVGIAQLLLENK